MSANLPTERAQELRGGWYRLSQLVIAGPLALGAAAVVLASIVLALLSSQRWSYQLTERIDWLAILPLIVLLALFLASLLLRPSPALTLLVALALMGEGLAVLSHPWLLLTCAGGALLVCVVFLIAGRGGSAQSALLAVVGTSVAAGLIALLALVILATQNLGLLFSSSHVASVKSPQGTWQLVTRTDSMWLASTTRVLVTRERCAGLVRQSRTLFEHEDVWPEVRWIDGRTVQIAGKTYRPFAEL